MKKRVAKQFLFTVTPIFILQALMFALLFGSYYSFTAKKIKELGVSNMRSQTTMAEDCLNKGRNVLWIAAMTVDHMMNDGAGSDEILRYLVTGSDNTTRHFDPDFTGIYGLIGGKYLDGAGWTPPEDYDPKKGHGTPRRLKQKARLYSRRRMWTLRPAVS